MKKCRASSFAGEVHRENVAIGRRCANSYLFMLCQWWATQSGDPGDLCFRTSWFWCPARFWDHSLGKRHSHQQVTVRETNVVERKGNKWCMDLVHCLQPSKFFEVLSWHDLVQKAVLSLLSPQRTISSGLLRKGQKVPSQLRSCWTMSLRGNNDGSWLRWSQRASEAKGLCRIPFHWPRHGTS